MEQFSRECLEIDTAAQAQKGDRSDVFVNASMDKVHDRAAKLIKRTLDVEGVIIMDVSHCEVLETISAESTVSVVMHYGDPQTEAKSHLLSLEEYRNLTSFFAKHPDGKISEGIISHSLRPFLPIHIQYALSTADHLSSSILPLTHYSCLSCSHFQYRQASIRLGVCLQCIRQQQTLCKEYNPIP